MKRIFVIAAVVMIALIGAVSANIVSSSDPQQPYVSFYENKYSQPLSGWPVDSYGYAEFRMYAVTARDPWVFVTRKGSDVVLDKTFYMDGTLVDNINPHMLKVYVYPAGTSKPELLAAGTYVAYVRNGEADQVESKEFTVGNGETTYVPFQGQAMPSLPKPVVQAEPEPEPTEPCNSKFC